MNRTVLSIALMLGPTLLAAQTIVAPKESSLQTTAIQLAAALDNCPVSLHAQQMPGWDRMVVNGVPLKTMAQTLRLTASTPGKRQVSAANITVHGYSNKARLLPTEMTNQNTGDAAKTIDVTFAATGDKDASTDVSVAGLSAVTVVDVNSVTYSDGSTWRLAAGRSCRSWIDGVMLVSGR